MRRKGGCEKRGGLRAGGCEERSRPDVVGLRRNVARGGRFP